MTQHWHFMRVLRLAIGALAMVEAFRTGEWLLTLPGGILLAQGIFNLGCGGQACAPPSRAFHTGRALDEPVEAEEIK